MSDSNAIKTFMQEYKDITEFEVDDEELNGLFNLTENVLRNRPNHIKDDENTIVICDNKPYFQKSYEEEGHDTYYNYYNCPNCNNSIKEFNKYCAGCGYKIEWR